MKYIMTMKEGDVRYFLRRINGGDVNVVVVTARGRDYEKLLDPAERSSLGRLSIELKPYSSKQLFDILSDRVEGAFVKGAKHWSSYSFMSNT